MIAQSPQRDRAWGRFLARRGTARVLAEAETAPHNDMRLARWAATWFRHGFHRQPERIRATVPKPFMPASRRDSATTPPPEVAAVRAGSIQETKQ